MGLKEDLERFNEIGEQRRQDLEEFIKHGNLGDGDRINIPIKIVDLPEFAYNPWDQGGVGQGDAEEGDPVDAQPQPADDDEEGDPGEDGGDHGYYEMDPEEFAEELDEELGLDLDPKGKKVSEVVEGDFTDVARTGPDSTLDFDRMFKQGLKRKLAMHIDEEYLREVLCVAGIGPQSAFEWARGKNIPVSKGWLEQEYDKLSSDEKTTYDSIDDIDRNLRRQPVARDIDSIPFRPEDKRYRHPEYIEKKERNVVVINIRDVSGSMRKTKRDLVERVFTPMDWYLTGKYDNADFRYIAHDAEAWEVDRVDFFGIRSGGGTRISEAYKLAQDILDEHYPWSEWNRYVFAAGDGENTEVDTRDEVIPLMEDIDANLHGYVEVTPGSAKRAIHGDLLEQHFGEDHDEVAIARVEGKDDVTDAIYDILSTEQEADE